MYEFGEIPQRIARVAAPTIAALALVAGCAVGSEQDRYPEVPEAGVVAPDTVGTTSTSTTIEPTGLCATENPEIAPFNTADTAAEDLHAGKSSVEMMDFFSSEYGLAPAFIHVATGDMDPVYNFGAPNTDPKAQTPRDVEGENLLELAEGLDVFTPELIRALNLNQVAFAYGITKKPEYADDKTILDAAGGLYNYEANSIYLDVAANADTVVHEFSHAIDAQLLCSPEDTYTDEAFSKFNTLPYQGFEKFEDNQQLLGPYTNASPSREFVNAYGATNAAEDRATIVEWTFSQRGLILESDLDWNSPLAHKQAELVRRLEELTPGVTKYLEERTPQLRAKIREEASIESIAINRIETADFPGVYMSPEEYMVRAYEDQIPVEVLADGIVTLPALTQEGLYSIGSHPVIIRDPRGEIAAVAWNDQWNSLETATFDKASMKLYSMNQTPDFQKGTLSISELDSGSSKGPFMSDMRVNKVAPVRYDMRSAREEATWLSNYPYALN